MSPEAYRWAKRQRPGGIALKAALIALAELADRAGVCSLPSSRIAEEADTDERTVRRLLGRLGVEGLVEVEQRPGRTTIYRLAMPATPGSQPGVTSGSQPGPTPGSAPEVTPGSRPDVGTTPGSQPGVSAPTPGSQPDVTRTDVGLSARPLPLQGGELSPPPSGVEPRAHASAHPRARPRETPIPADWAPHAGHLRHAARRGADLDHEATQFRAHALANDRRQVDWDASFDLWLGNARVAHRPGSSLLPAGANGAHRTPTTTARVQAIEALKRPENGP